MTATDRFTRTARGATLVSAAVALVCVLAAIALSLLGRPGSPVEQVEVTDDAGVIDPVLVEERIGELRTYAPVRVVVWTRQGEPSDNINAEALEWARSQPEKDLLSPDGRKWADGLFLLALNVEQDDTVGSGQIATHFGEDVKVEPVSEQKKLQEQGYDDFRNRSWEDGLVAIADAAAGEMARPAWTRAGISLVLPLVLAGLALANAAGVQIMRVRFAEAADRFTRTTENVHATVSATEFILDHGFGGKVRNTAASLLRQYDRTLDERDAIADSSRWAVTAANVSLWSRIKRLNEAAGDIGESTGVVQRATSLYSADGQWEQVWQDEVEETAKHLQEARDSDTIRRRAGAAQAGELAAFCTQALAQLDDIREQGTRGGGENIEECLERISGIRAELTRRMQAIEAAAMPSNRSHARYVDKAIMQERRRRSARSRSITGFYDRPSFYSPTAFAIGYTSGTRRHQAAEKARQSASRSSGSNTSFGSSGGGFSGSGSSSRF